MLRPDRDDLAEMPAQVQHDPGAQGSSAGVRPAASGVYRDPVLRGVARNRDHIVLGPRDDHAQRIDFIQAGIGA